MKKLSAILTSFLCMTAILLVMTSCSDADEPAMPYITPSELQPSVNDAEGYVSPDDEITGASQVSDPHSAPSDSASDLNSGD